MDDKCIGSQRQEVAGQIEYIESTRNDFHQLQPFRECANHRNGSCPNPSCLPAALAEHGVHDKDIGCGPQGIGQAKTDKIRYADMCHAAPEWVNNNVQPQSVGHTESQQLPASEQHIDGHSGQ